MPVVTSEEACSGFNGLIVVLSLINPLIAINNTIENGVYIPSTELALKIT
jgi:hypothetical protein